MTDRQTELIEKIRLNLATEAEAAELYQSVLRFLYKVARQYSSRLRCHHLEGGEDRELQDLVQDAFFSVIAAARSYDPEAGASFITYLEWFVRRGIENQLASQHGVSIDAIHARQRLDKYEAELSASFGCFPTDKQICVHLDISPERLLFLRNIGTDASLDQPLGDDDRGSLSDVLPDEKSLEDEVLDAIVAREVSSKLRQYVDELPSDERRAVVFFYIRNATDAQGAEKMGVTVSAFRRLRAKGIKRLRSKSHLDELGRYLPERLGSLAYKGSLGLFRGSGSSTELTAMRLIEIENERKYNYENYYRRNPENGK